MDRDDAIATMNSLHKNWMGLGMALGIVVDELNSGVSQLPGVSDEISSAAAKVLATRTPPKDSIVEIPAEFVIAAKSLAGFVLQKDDTKGPNAQAADNAPQSDTSGYTDEEKNARANALRAGVNVDPDATITNPARGNDAKG